MSLIKRYSHVNWVLADQAILSAVNFFFGVLLARYLGLDAFGVFSLAWMVALFFTALQVALIVSPMFSIPHDEIIEDFKYYYGSVWVIQLFFAILVCVGLYLGLKLCDVIFPQWGTQGFELSFTVAVFFMQLQEFVRRCFIVQDMVVAAFINDVICYLGRLAILIWWLGYSVLSISSVFWVVSVVSAASVIVGLFYGKIYLWRYKELKVICIRYWGFSKWLAGSAIVQFISGNMFIFVASAMLGSSAAGAIKAVQTILAPINVFFLGFENIVPVRASRNFYAKGITSLYAYLRKVTVVGLLCTLMIAGIVVVMPEFWLKLAYGTEYIVYGHLVYWYAAIYAVAYLLLPLKAGLRALEVTRPIFYAPIFGLVIGIIVVFPLINEYGLDGAMFGMLGVFVVELCILFKYLIKFQVEKID